MYVFSFNVNVCVVFLNFLMLNPTNLIVVFV